MARRSAPSSTVPVQSIAAFASHRLSALANPAKAKGMAAYMKTTQPFFGVQNPDREPIFREMCKVYAPKDGSAYRANVLALWAAGCSGDAVPIAPGTKPPRRDSKMIPPVYSGQRELLYGACHYAETFEEHLTPAHLPLFKRMIMDGGWWDLVDGIAGGMVSPMLMAQRSATATVLRKWVEDENLWVRRTAIIAQVGHKDKTDLAMLADFCLRRADETDFFIRKAVGWALRSYAWTDPDWVRGFLKRHRKSLSPLSIREAGKNIGVKP